MSWVALGTTAVGAGMSMMNKKKAGGQQMMNAGNIMAPEDKWAEGARQKNFDFVSNMMDDVSAGRDPLQNRRDQQLEHQTKGIREDFFGTEGDRNESIANVGVQQMAMFGGNAKQMLAQKKKTQNRMQGQLDDVRQRIADAGTSYIEKQSQFAPEMMNRLKTGAATTGSFGPQAMGAPSSGGGPDMAGISSMVGAGIGTIKKSGFSANNVSGSGLFGSKFMGKTVGEMGQQGPMNKPGFRDRRVR